MTCQLKLKQSILLLGSGADVVNNKRDIAAVQTVTDNHDMGQMRGYYTSDNIPGFKV